MAKKLSVDLGLNASNFTQGARDVIKQTNSMTQSVQEYVQQNGNLVKQLRQAKRDAQNLAVQFNDLSAAERDTEFGHELAENLDFAMRKAAELQDVFEDTNTAVKNLASDTAPFDALQQGFSAVGDCVISVMGGIAALTGNQEDYNRAIATWMTIENGLNAVMKIRQLFLKQLPVMQAIGTLQTKAATAATALQTSTTVGATVAQKAFNLVAKANPYVLLATAALTVVGALVGFSAATDDATESQQEMSAQARLLQEENERLAQSQRDLATKTADSASDMIGNYMELQAKWEECGGDIQKQQQFLEDYRGKLDETGITINDVATAEKVFGSGAKAVINSLYKRAEAAAYAAVAYEQLKHALLLEQERSVDSGHFYVKTTAKNFTNDELQAFYKVYGRGADTHIDPDHLTERFTNFTDERRKEEARRRQAAYRQTAERERALSRQNFNMSAQKDSEANAELRAAGYTPYRRSSRSQSYTPRRVSSPAPHNTGGSGSGSGSDVEDKEKQLTELQKLLKERDELEKNFAAGTVTRDDFIKEYRKLSTSIRNERVKAGIYKEGETRDFEERLEVEKTLLSVTEENTEEYKQQADKVKGYERDLRNALVNLDPEHYIGPLRESFEQAMQPIDMDVTVNLVSEDAQKKFTELVTKITQAQTALFGFQQMLDKNESGEEILGDQEVTAITGFMSQLEGNIQEWQGAIQAIKSQNIQDIISDALTPPKEEPDFSHLSEAAQKEAERLKTQIEKIKEYMAMLQAIINDPESTSEDKAAAQAGYDQLNTMLHGSDHETEEGGVEGTTGLEGQLEGLSNQNDKLEEHYAKVQKLSDAYNAFAEITNSTLDAIGKFSDEGTKAWLSFTVTTLKSIGQMIVALLNLCKGEAAASAFELPFPKNIAAYAIMAATIIGIFASIPKFAEGGIVGGGSMSGDKLIARVNSGEMILNSRQQRHLFNVINNGVASNNSAMGVQSIKVRGSDLYLALENYKREKHL